MADTDATLINVPYPDDPDTQLTLAVGACRLKIAPGGGETWVDGTYRHPRGPLEAVVTQEGGRVRISQRYEFASTLGLLGGVPSFDLRLGAARPYALVIETGASENVLDLGGLPLGRLVAKHGAGTMDIDFSAPNPETMTLLDLGTGAGTLELRRLANANFVEMRLEGGAASYRVDFSGELRRDGNVRIATGMSSVEIAIPASTAAKVRSESLLGNLDVGDGWSTREGAFWTAAALEGRTPVLSISTNVALGALRLRVL